MSALPLVDLDHVVDRLVRLLHTSSPPGDTEAALALVAGWLREMGLAPAFTRKGAEGGSRCPAAMTPPRRRAPSPAMWPRWAPS